MCLFCIRSWRQVLICVGNEKNPHIFLGRVCWFCAYASLIFHLAALPLRRWGSIFFFLDNCICHNFVTNLVVFHWVCTFAIIAHFIKMKNILSIIKLLVSTLAFTSALVIQAEVICILICQQKNLALQNLHFYFIWLSCVSFHPNLN